MNYVAKDKCKQTEVLRNLDWTYLYNQNEHHIFKMVRADLLIVCNFLDTRLLYRTQRKGHFTEELCLMTMLSHLVVSDS